MLNKRRADVAIILLSFVALAISARVVTVGINQLWGAERLFYALANYTAEPFDGNRDIPVLLFIGALFGWLLLFLVDGTKRIQALLIVVIGTLSVGVFLSETGRILDAIGRHPSSFVIGTAFGLVTGAASARLYGVKTPESMGLMESLTWLQFDNAAAAFRHGISLIVIVATVDYILFAPPVSAGGYAVSSLVLMVALSVFVQYDYQRNVVAISPPDDDDSRKYHPYVYGGLYHEAYNAYHGFTIKGGGVLVQAQRASSLSSLLKEFNQMVAFGFASGIRTSKANGVAQLGAKILPRTVRLESRGVTTTDLPSIISERSINQAVLLLKLSVRRILRHIVTLVPSIVRDQLPDRGFTKTDRLDRADVILLIGPTLDEDEPLPAGAEVFDHICARYSSDPTTEVVLTTTEAPPDSVRDHDVRVRAQENLEISRNNLSWTKVYPVSRFGRDGDIHGFKPLLDDLSE